MTDPTPMLIGPDRVNSDDVIEVRSPYDDHLVGTVARGGTSHLEAALQTGQQVLAEGPLPAYQRAARSSLPLYSPCRNVIPCSFMCIEGTLPRLSALTTVPVWAAHVLPWSLLR